MEWLWSRWSQVEEQICRSRHTLLLLDYDGTLTPIVPAPEKAKLPSAMKSALRHLSRSPKVTVAILSGRALGEITRLVGLRHLIYAGNHGLEIRFKRLQTRVTIPGSSREAISRIRPRLASLIAGVPGAYLEDKGISLSLHYRLVQGDQVNHLKAALHREILPSLRSGAICLLSGKRVIEARPSVNWTKGHAALWLVKRLRRRSLLSIYIGDDRTDEDVFRLLKGGITIRVGIDRKSAAKYYVRGVGEVQSLLEWMVTTYA